MLSPNFVEIREAEEKRAPEEKRSKYVEVYGRLRRYALFSVLSVVAQLKSWYVTKPFPKSRILNEEYITLLNDELNVCQSG